jgi:outer membrane lipoprotein SlyB
VRATLCCLLPALSIAAGCYTTSTTTTTWTSPPPPLSGQVEAVTETVRRVEGNPAGGAITGAIIGGLAAPRRWVGALFGAAVGGAVSQGSSESRWYDVLVRFDDGTRRVFRYGGASPFAPGDRVLLASNQLSRR